MRKKHHPSEDRVHSTALEYLDAVARHGSIRRAADALGVASSGVNRLILRLEAELGSALFVRSRVGVSLTPAGERLVRHARETIAQYQRVKAEVASLDGVVGGEVAVIAIPSLISRFLPSIITAVAESHPLVQFRVAEANPTQITSDVQAARYDIGLVLIDRPHRDIDIIMQVEAPVGAVMRHDHPLSQRQTLALEDCAGYPVVLLDDMWVLGPTLDYERTTIGSRMIPRLVSNSFELNSRMIKAGYGIGFFTAVNFVDEIAAGEMVHVPLSDGMLRAASIGIIVPRAAAISPPAAAVIDIMRAELPKLFGGWKSHAA